MSIISPTYRSWAMMKNRCLNPNAMDFAYYGGRGIRVCRSWLKFKNFLADMGSRPDGTTLDRKNNNKGYTPKNCRWATKQEQSRNRRDVKLSLFLATKIREEFFAGAWQSDLAEEFNLSVRSVAEVTRGASWL